MNKDVKLKIEKYQDVTEVCDKVSAVSLGLAALSSSFVICHSVFASDDIFAMAGLGGTALGVIGSCIANTIGDIAHDKGQDLAFKEVEKSRDLQLANDMEMGE